MVVAASHCGIDPMPCHGEFFSLLGANEVCGIQRRTSPCKYEVKGGGFIHIVLVSLLFFMLLLGVIVYYSMEITGINALFFYAIFGCNRLLFY
jgi:hypothetical protein